MKKYLITFLCLGSLIGYIFYLGVDDSLKYDYETTWIVLSKPISYGSACSALFFGMYIIYGLVVLLYLKGFNNILDKIAITTHSCYSIRNHSRMDRR